MVSGSALVLLRSRLAGREAVAFRLLTALTPPLLLLAPALAHRVRFDPTQLMWEPRQWLALPSKPSLGFWLPGSHEYPDHSIHRVRDRFDCGFETLFPESHHHGVK